MKRILKRILHVSSRNHLNEQGALLQLFVANFAGTRRFDFSALAEPTDLT